MTREQIEIIVAETMNLLEHVYDVGGLADFGMPTVQEVAGAHRARPSRCARGCRLALKHCRAKHFAAPATTAGPQPLFSEYSPGASGWDAASTCPPTLATPATAHARRTHGT